MHLSPQQRAALLEEARAVIRRRLSGGDGAGSATAGSAAPGSALPGAAPAVAGDSCASAPDAVLSQHAGCFVSLHELRSHRLRGCVGRLEATGPLWDTVRAVAVNVLSDPRFVHQPVTRHELPDLEIEISVLSPL